MPEAAPLTVLGLGPGSVQFLTPAARTALTQAQCLAGYTRYLELVPPDLKLGKRLIASGMREERKRCQLSIEAALAGETTALVCSGDPGIYALASLTLQLLAEQNLDHIPLRVIPGVPAFCAAGAALGAPLGHDFASISLSDLLTPLDIIFRRLEAALAADFVIVLYNPRSRGRPDHLGRFLDLARSYRSPACPVGICRNISRPEESVILTTLAQCDPSQVDMLSTVIVGNSQTCRWGDYMITPRGYGSANIS